jgi:predicted CoA-binding protein
MAVYDDEGVGWKNPSPENIRKLLKDAKVIAVIGLSSDPSRASYGVASYLKEQGYRVIPVNPNEPEILGEKSYKTLKDIPVKVDIVDVFRRPEAAPAIIEEAISIGAKGVWLQESVISTEAFKRGEKAGIIMIMDRCIYKEHARFMG